MAWCGAWPGHRKPEFHVSAAHRKRSHFLHSSRLGGGWGEGGLTFPMGNFPEECVEEHGEYLAACSQQVTRKQSQSLGHLVAGFKSH
jgi:hypothetical protein